MQEYESVKQQLEKDGYKISNAEFSCLVEYAKRKVKIAGKDESYIPILLPDMVKEYFFRMGVNLETRSVGDSMYLNIGLQAVDSAEKFYISIVAR